MHTNANIFYIERFFFYFTLLINKCSQISISNQLQHPFCNLVGKKGKFEIVHLFLIRRKKNELWGRQFDSKGMGGWQIFKDQNFFFRQYHLF